MLELITSLAKLENKTLNDVVEIAKTKQQKRGGFDKNILKKSNTKILSDKTINKTQTIK